MARGTFWRPDCQFLGELSESLVDQVVRMGRRVFATGFESGSVAPWTRSPHWPRHW